MLRQQQIGSCFVAVERDLTAKKMVGREWLDRTGGDG